LLLVLVLALIAAILVTPSAQLYLRSKQAEAALEALQQKAMPVLAERESFTQTAERLKQAGEPFNQSVAPLPVLQLITEALGDDTSLLNLQVQGHKVSMSGQTANASALMKKLGSQPGLRDVRAPSPATKPLGATRESFAIEFTMDPAQWPTVPTVTDPSAAQSLAPTQANSAASASAPVPSASAPASASAPGQPTKAKPPAAATPPLAAPSKPAAVLPPPSKTP
jgi:general secretion pathway protein L